VKKIKGTRASFVRLKKRGRRGEARDRGERCWLRRGGDRENTLEKLDG